MHITSYGLERGTNESQPLGHFEYLLMPFWLINTPTVFQAMVNDLLQDMINRFVFIYLVRRVLHWLLENKLFVKAEKCWEEFCKTSVGFLGYIVEQMKADLAKVQVVVEWPVSSETTTFLQVC